MTSKYIPEGYILLARVITESEIWHSKPSWWLKVWLKILQDVNHTDNSKFKRGSNFFTREKIYYDCSLINDRVKPQSVDNVIRYLRQTTMITTQKTTRGIIISVCNYDKYQNKSNYKNDTVNDKPNETGTRQERDRNDTINKNDKNDKKENNIYIPEWDEFREYALSKKENVNQESMRFKYDAWVSDGWKDGNGKKIKNWKSKVNHSLQYWGTQKIKKESLFQEQSEEQFHKERFGFDYREDMSHIPEWEKEANRLGITGKQYGSWRFEYSEKIGGYTSAHPLPRTEYPEV